MTRALIRLMLNFESSSACFSSLSADTTLLELSNALSFCHPEPARPTEEGVRRRRIPTVPVVTSLHQGIPAAYVYVRTPCISAVVQTAPDPSSPRSSTRKERNASRRCAQDDRYRRCQEAKTDLISIKLKVKKRSTLSLLAVFLSCELGKLFYPEEHKNLLFIIFHDR